MRTKEQIEKEIESQKDMIAVEKRFHPDSEELSFLYYQLHELEDELIAYDEKTI